MAIFVRGYSRYGRLVKGYVKASGPHSLLRGVNEAKPKGIRLGGKSLTRAEVKSRAKAALARARQIQTVRAEAISKRPKLY